MQQNKQPRDRETTYLSNPEILGEGTDWQDALFRTATKQEYNLSVRGGSKSVNYNISGGYFTQDGIVINNDFNRFTMRSSVDVKAYKLVGFRYDIQHVANKPQYWYGNMGCNK